MPPFRVRSRLLAICRPHVYGVYIMRNKVDSVNMKAAVEKGRKKAAYHHGNLRQALLDAGLRQLEEKGSRGEPSLRELARQVGVTVNAAYRHFADKEAVMSAMAAEGFRRFGNAQDRAAKGQTDPQLALQALGQAYIRFARDNPALFRLMFGRFNRTRVDPELDDASQKAFDSLLKAVSEALQRETSDPEVTMTAVSAWGLVHGLSHLLLDGRLDWLSDDPERLVEKALNSMSSQLSGG